MHQGVSVCVEQVGTVLRGRVRLYVSVCGSRGILTWQVSAFPQCSQVPYSFNHPDSCGFPGLVGKGIWGPIL